MPSYLGGESKSKMNENALVHINVEVLGDNIEEALASAEHFHPYAIKYEYVSQETRQRSMITTIKVWVDDVAPEYSSNE